MSNEKEKTKKSKKHLRISLKLKIAIIGSDVAGKRQIGSRSGGNE